jgi:hypothetical protein
MIDDEVTRVARKRGNGKQKQQKEGSKGFPKGGKSVDMICMNCASERDGKSESAGVDE